MRLNGVQVRDALEEYLDALEYDFQEGDGEFDSELDTLGALPPEEDSE